MKQKNKKKIEQNSVLNKRQRERKRKKDSESASIQDGKLKKNLFRKRIPIRITLILLKIKQYFL